jgi:dTDP-6-deoxy-L-talose 4-dehydrogenase (NAD+)
MTTVALTGATGFVGRQILHHLLEAGQDVRAIVLAGEATDPRLLRPNVEIVKTSNLFAEPIETLRTYVEGYDTLIHAAWYVEPGHYLASPLNLECLIGTLRLAEAFKAAGGHRFVGLGTCFEYDVDAGLLSTATPLRPHTLYAASKTAVFQVLSHLLPLDGVEFAWCRLFYLYGEGEDERRLVPYLRQRLAAGESAELTSGNQIRDFLDVAEAGAMIAEIALGGRQGPVNICSGVPITVRKLAEKIADEYGRRDLLQFGARPDNAVDPPRVVGVREDW